MKPRHTEKDTFQLQNLTPVNNYYNLVDLKNSAPHYLFKRVLKACG